MRARNHRDPLQAFRGFFSVLLSAIVVSCPVFAQDSVDAVLERMKSTSANRIVYQETRYLELFDKPVEASGMFYGIPPDSLIKEQLTPSREVMGILKDRLYYFDPANGVRHSQARDSEDPMNLHIAAFQSLANGNRDLLNDLYSISFFTEPGHWYMILSDKNKSRSLIRITVSGSTQHPADKIEIHEADDDRSVYRLAKDAEGEDIRTAVLRLIAELTGQ
ncbi:MAG: LolA family protein [Methylococcales bacterium]